MIVQVLFFIEVLVLVVTAPLALIFLARNEMRREGRRISAWERTLWIGLGALTLAPLLYILSILGWFAAANFPFDSGVIAEGSAQTGEQACVVQTFKGAEPYQVSLYVRRAGGPWAWHYLAHQDVRWRDCRIEFEGGALRVYTGATLRKTISLAEAIPRLSNAENDLPENFTPQQIAARHNEYFRR